MILRGLLTSVPLLTRLLSLAEQALLTLVVLAPLLITLLLVFFVLLRRLLDFLFRIVILILLGRGARTEGGNVAILLKEDLLPD